MTYNEIINNNVIFYFDRLLMASVFFGTCIFFVININLFLIEEVFIYFIIILLFSKAFSLIVSSFIFLFSTKTKDEPEETE